MIPSVDSAIDNYIIIATDNHEIIGYAYSNISPKTYSNGFATLERDSFFDFDSVQNKDVGCLSQFYIKEDYRHGGALAVFYSRNQWIG